ncbi:GGDEF domain-containing protein [Kordiimonas marina]|uniref:GGDEF domain-containing protein n=1 Tax=Kordiimonas marina TaxID=2872312 RepID=UPI001FF15134|nr:GGDEF domain-containing protein [Kordiimonas marina]MCJ9429496.1 GGDEF domain-containing protein [Kordiimonas marina]
MLLDLPTLIVATTLILILSSVALIAHWLANFGVQGLKEIAGGVVVSTAGICLMAPIDGPPLPMTVLLGDLMILMGHFWVWLGIADFWGARSRQLVYLAGSIMAAAMIVLCFNFVKTEAAGERDTLLSVFIVAMSVGTSVTLVHAFGGRVALYKGIIKRTALGAALTSALFMAHALFNLYRAAEWRGLAHGAGMDSVSSLAAWTQVEAMLFVFLLALTVIIMTAERLQHELKIQAMMDPLTGALNRRAFMAVVKTVLARARRVSEPVSLIMIDIDKFKRINVEHGHLFGDAILQSFAELVMQGRRSQDVFCRFGGEEFVLLLPGTEEEGAAIVANRVRESISRGSLSHGDTVIELTLSVGVMTARGDDLDADGMLDVAYKMLREAQKAGQNTIRFAEPLTAEHQGAPA